MKTKVVIFNVFGHGNSGDAMLVESLIDQIESAIPDVEIHGVAFDVNSQRRWCPTVLWSERIAQCTSRSLLGRLQQLYVMAISILIACTAFFYFLRWLMPREQRAAVKALKDAPLAISCPGGYLEDSNNAYYLNILQVFVALRLAKKVVLAPMSIGPIRSTFGKKLIRSMLNRVGSAYFREEKSLSFCVSLYDTDEIADRRNRFFLAGDMAFWYKPSKSFDVSKEYHALGLEPNERFVGITIINWTFPGHVDRSKSLQLYLDALSLLVDEVERTGRRVVVFNQVFDDLVATERLAARHPSLIVDRGERPSEALAELIGKCDVFIGSRFHSCIFSLLGGVPTAAISYLPKTSGIMKILGLSEYVAEIDSVTGDQLKMLFRILDADKVSKSAEVVASVERYRASNDEFLAYLKTFALSRGPGPV